MLAGRDGEGNLLRKNIFGPRADEITCVIARRPLGDEAIYYYTHDELGSVSEILDEQGSVIEKYTYDIYGKVEIKNAARNILLASVILSEAGFGALNQIKDKTGSRQKNRWQYIVKLIVDSVLSLPCLSVQSRNVGCLDSPPSRRMTKPLKIKFTMQ